MSQIVFVGSSLEDHFWSSTPMRYVRALKEMLFDVHAYTHRQAAGIIAHWPHDRRILTIVQDTHLPIPDAVKLRGQVDKLVLFTHSESIQGVKDIGYILAMKPDLVATDQPSGVQMFNEVVKAIWMGCGADPACRVAPNKDIDVLWVGNKYDARDPDVQREVVPLLDEAAYKVQVYGDGYPGGLLKPSEMFERMSRAKVVVHICHPVCDRDGYGGQRISDALASGAYVVSTRYPYDSTRFPFGVSFVGRDDVRQTVLDVLRDYDEPWMQERRGIAISFVNRLRMAKNDLERVFGYLQGVIS